ncbi:MAG: pseudaminic acid synthase, partial [Patescibacteria group bacterium]
MNLNIGKRAIGPGQPAFIVAEMSGNHNRDYNKALKLIDAAARAGADAVKLQTYTADTMTLNLKTDYFRIRADNPWKGRTLYELYQSAATPWEWQPKLKKYAEERGLVLFSTPFDETAVDFLEKMDVRLYKVASYEITDIPLLRKIGKLGKPVILSRGLASEQEVAEAVAALRQSGTSEIAVLQCADAYPAPAAEMNLATIPDIAKRFGVVAGLSDHTLGVNVAVAAVALGASIIEKHLTLSRASGGPDASFSLEPAELAELVKAAREVERAVGQVSYKLGREESENLVFRRSLFVVADIKKGEEFTAQNVR